MKTPSTEAGSLRAALTDDQIVAAMNSSGADPAFVRVHFASIRAFAHEVAALSAASPPEPAGYEQFLVSWKKFQQDWDAFMGHQAEASSRGAVQRQENSTEDSRDAARYRWFRDRWWLDPAAVMTPDPLAHATTADECDAAIDAAMKEQP